MVGSPRPPVQQAPLIHVNTYGVTDYVELPLVDYATVCEAMAAEWDCPPLSVDVVRLYSWGEPVALGLTRRLGGLRVRWNDGYRFDTVIEAVREFPGCVEEVEAPVRSRRDG